METGHDVECLRQDLAIGLEVLYLTCELTLCKIDHTGSKRGHRRLAEQILRPVVRIAYIDVNPQ